MKRAKQVWNSIGLSLIFCLATWSVVGQQAILEGVVRDQETKEALIGAYVELKGHGQIVATDDKGQFQFKALDYGTYLVQISYTGKANLEREVVLKERHTSLDLKLEDISIGLETVIVQSDKEASMGLYRLRAVEGVAIYEGKKSEVVDLQTITANLAANNPRQVFARVAGLNIWESDGAGLQLGIGGRGLSPNRTSNFNTRQNGYDISADALGYPESYYTPPTEALQRIEVVRGAASLQYGTQFGGMLNFVFKEAPKDKPFSLTTRQTVGAFGFLGSFNSIGGTLGKDKFSYYGFFQRKEGDGWRPNSQFKLNNGFVSLGFRPTKRLELGVEWTRMNYLAQQPGGLTDVLFEQDARRSFRERNWFSVDWDLLAFTLDYRFSSRTRLNIRQFRLDAGRQSLGNLAPINVVDFGGNRNLIDGEFNNWGNETRLLHRYRIGAQEHTFVVGLRYYRGDNRARQGEANDGNGADFDFLQPDNVEQSDYRFDNENLALFAEHIFHLSPKLSLTPGIRYEYIQTGAEGYYQQRVFDAAGNLIVSNREEESTVRPRNFLLLGLGASYKFSSQLELYANMSQNYRAINFSDLRIDNPNGRVDPDIRDEEGYTLDLGLRSRGGAWFYADVTAFFVSYRDRIGLQLLADQPPLFNDIRLRTNIADARNIGVEAYVEADFWRLLKPQDSLTRLSVFLNASVIDAKYSNTDDRSIDGREVELVPPFTLRTGITFQKGAFRTAATIAFTAEHFTDATNARRTSSAVNGIIPAYTVADLSAAYKWRNFSLELSVNNLLDARYFTRRAEAYPGPGIIPADGRAWFVTLAYEL